LWTAAVIALAKGAQAASRVQLQLNTEEKGACEGIASFPTRLSRRGIELAESSDVEVDVRAVQTPDGAEASFVLRDKAQSTSSTRSLRAASCDEVLEGVAFTLSLALEHRRLTVTEEVLPAGPVPPQPVKSPKKAPVRSPFSWGVGVSMGVVSGVAKEAAWAPQVQLEAALHEGRVVSPAAFLGARFVLPSFTTLPDAQLSFALQMATLGACPLRFAAGRFAARPCVELEAGRMQGRSAGFVGARLASTPWFAVGMGLRGRVAMVGPFGLDVAVSATAPLDRAAFKLGEVVVHEVNLAVFSGSVGLGVHFP
jgi:hypothetical protein